MFIYRDARRVFLLVGFSIIICVSGLSLALEGLWQDALPPSVLISWTVPSVVGCMLLTLLVHRLLTCRSTQEEDAARLQAILDAAPDAGIICQQDRHILLANEQAARLFGYDPAALIGMSIDVLIPNWLRSANLTADRTMHPHSSGSWRMGMGEDLVGRRSDGNEIPIELSVSPLEHDGQRLIVSFIRNISERKRLEERVRQAHKLEAVGRLAGGVAHDFNNLLTAIIGYSDLLAGSLPAGDPVRDGLNEIKKAGDRAAALTQQLLAFSRRQLLQPTVLDLNSLLTDTERMLRRLVPEDIELVVELGQGIRPVRADLGQTQQVLINLVLNARDAMPRGGRVILRTGNADLSQNYLRAHPDVKPGPYAMLMITDNGCGMDADTLAHLFEPFFTTKGQGKGTGLGLATVYGIIKQSGGHIEVSSSPGQGTTFRVYLPSAEENVSTVSMTSGLTRTPTANETILVAEDEDAVRNLARRVLESKGYTVLDARNGHQALQLCRQHPGTVNVLLTDVVMPQMNGPQLADQVRALYPDVRVIFMSGYTDSTIFSRGVSEGDVILLPKPFKSENLLQLVREVLDKVPTPTA